MLVDYTALCSFQVVSRFQLTAMPVLYSVGKNTLDDNDAEFLARVLPTTLLEYVE